MGEASRKKKSPQFLEAQQKAKESLRRLVENDFDVVRRASSALERLATAASSHLGNDCYTHAILGQALLRDAGVETSLAIGFAGWRVGGGDSDMVLHVPLKGVPLTISAEGKGISYHAWLTIDATLPDGQGKTIVDLTTYQLREKARQLDLIDSGHTQVDWCPPFLVVNSKQTKSIKQVISDRAGDAYYEPVPHLESVIKAAAIPLDQEDLAVARLLYANPQINVVGPNDF